MRIERGESLLGPPTTVREKKASKGEVGEVGATEGRHRESLGQVCKSASAPEE